MTGGWLRWMAEGLRELPGRAKKENLFLKLRLRHRNVNPISVGYRTVLSAWHISGHIV
jgi:hypothetical protein